MTDAHHAPSFSPLFDRALAACAQAQMLATRCRESQAHARATNASSRRLRMLAAETRAAWADTSAVFILLHREVEAVARAMRDVGTEHAQASATVRAHVRFVLYDGGLREQEAEAVVSRASEWVDRVYQAA